MRALIFKPPFLLLFAALNVLIAADFNSRGMAAAASVGVVACLIVLLRQVYLHWRSKRVRIPFPRKAPLLRRGLPYLLAAGIVVVAAYAEWVALHVAMDPWITPPPGPVRGEIRVTGPDFGKGVSWSPNLCRPAINPGVTAAALITNDDPFPLAWVIGRPDGGVAAIDVQRGSASTTIRFFPADCSRLHGDVQPVRSAVAGTSGLTGYADAECVHGGDTLTMHVDFNACAAASSAPAPARPSGRTRLVP